MDAREFRELVWERGHELYREMPWRDEPTFYHVLVSELMLQQTQVSRVLVKFTEFMNAFPSVDDLARASLADVLKVWQGLGYNRRAKFLHQAAKHIVTHDTPRSIEKLVELPGVGRNTAAAIMNYVYELPSAYVETNIRTVYFKHFFSGATVISDKELLVKVDETMDSEHPREWFWALMDYGASLKAQGEGRLDVSKHYKKQTPLKGSVREVRGAILRELGARDMTRDELMVVLDADERFSSAYDGLCRDGLIAETGGCSHLTK